MENNYGIKELYSVALKATYDIEIGGVKYEPNEVILAFDSIQLSAINENKSYIYARGGYGNKILITWDNTKDVTFSCTQGILSRRSLSILSNSTLTSEQEKPVSVPVFAEEHDPEDGFITLDHTPNGTGFIYDKKSGKKLYSKLTAATYAAQDTIIADYNYDYLSGFQTLSIGERMINGYMRLEGKMRLKDDSDGHEKTGIIIIPRLSIASSLNIRLGRNLSPMVTSFNFVGYPVGGKGAQKVCDIQFLNDDIDSDF